MSHKHFTSIEIEAFLRLDVVRPNCASETRSYEVGYLSVRQMVVWFAGFRNTLVEEYSVQNLNLQLSRSSMKDLCLLSQWGSGSITGKNHSVVDEMQCNHQYGESSWRGVVAIGAQDSSTPFDSKCVHSVTGGFHDMSKRCRTGLSRWLDPLGTPTWYTA